MPFMDDTRTQGSRTLISFSPPLEPVEGNGHAWPALGRKLPLTYMATAHSPCRLEELLLVVPEDVDRGDHFTVRDIHIATHRYPVDKRGAHISLEGVLTEAQRSLDVCESVFVTIESDADESYVVRPVFRCTVNGKNSDTHVLGASAVGVLATEPKRYRIGPEQKVPVAWQPPWLCRPRGLIARSDSRGALDVVEVHVGNRSQWHHRGSVPIELFFGEGMEFECDSVPLGVDISITVENLSKDNHWVEFDLIVNKVDPRDERSASGAAEAAPAL